MSCRTFAFFTARVKLVQRANRGIGERRQVTRRDQGILEEGLAGNHGNGMSSGLWGVE